MRMLAWTALALVVGTLAGVAVGKAVSGRSAPAAAPQLPGVEVAPVAERALPLFADATPAGAANAFRGAATGRAPEPNTDRPTPLDPKAAPPTEVLVLPHGPGRMATVDLHLLGVAQLPVFQGVMTRDGPANLTSIQRAPRVAAIRDADTQFELLHIGFDRDARPIAAHIKLSETGQEGIVVLAVTRKGQPDAVAPLRPVLAAELAPLPAERDR